jgi:hypothetical protein
MKALLLVFSLAAVFAQPPPATIAGDYVCQGESGGKTYELALIVQPHGDTFRLTWLHQEQPAFIGLGLQTADYLAVMIITPQGGGAVALYRVQAGALLGEWTGGDGHRYPESCRRGRSSA